MAKLCVKESVKCVKCVCLRRRRGREAAAGPGGAGYRIKNKNPTQRCHATQKTMVDVTKSHAKCHACHAKRQSMS